MRYELGVGGLLLVALALTGVMALQIGVLDFGDTVDVTVPMVDAAGLTSGSHVAVAGVEVGVVGPLTLDDDRALVTLHLSPGAEIRADVVARVRMESLLGQKYVELVPRSTSAEAVLLRDGDVLPLVGPQLEIDELVELVGAILGAVDEQTIADGIAALASAVEDDPERIERMIGHLDLILDNAASASKDLPYLTGDLRVTLAATRSTLRSLEERSAQAEGILARLDLVLAQLDAVAVPLPEIVQEARLALDDARRVLGHVDTATVQIEATAEVLEGFTPDRIEALLQEEGIRVRFTRARD